MRYPTGRLFSRRWSSCLAYFNNRPDKSIAAADLSVREKLKIMKTKALLPDSYRIEDGLVTLSSFIRNEVVESRFNGSCIEFYKMITKWSLEEIVEERNGKEILEAKRKFRYIRNVRNRFGSPRKQLMRIFMVEESVIDQLL